MRSITGKELCRILEKNGWILKRVNGSHHIFLKIGKRERISIPVHKGKDIKQGLLKAILKIAGIKDIK